jgi:hypothetical protein
MPIEAISWGMVDATIPIREFTAEGAPSGAVATRLGPHGMELACDQVPPGRYAWLGFDLPSGDSIKTLAEIVGVVGDAGRSRLLVRFKHLFPRDRVAMEGFLNARAAA